MPQTVPWPKSVLRISFFTLSGLFMTDKDFSEILGGVERDENGNIIGAKAVLHNFFGKMNSTQAMVEIHSLMDAVGVYVSLFPGVCKTYRYRVVPLFKIDLLLTLK